MTKDDDSNSVEVTKDLAESALMPQPLPKEESKQVEVKYVDVSGSVLSDLKDRLDVTEEKILDFARDSMKQNSDLLKKLSDKPESEIKSEDLVEIKAGGISKKQILFILLLVGVFIGYYKKDYIYDKLLLWWTKRNLPKHE